MPRPTKSLLNLEINGFSVLRCLSATEATTNNFMPLYEVQCLYCKNTRTLTKQGLLGVAACTCKDGDLPAPTLSPLQDDARILQRTTLRGKPDTDGHKSPATPDGTLLYLYPGHPSYRLGRKPKPVQKEAP